MNKLPLTFAAIAEVATGLALLVVPSLVGRLLPGTELTGVAIPIARVTGIALISLGVACFPRSTPLGGVLTYSALAAFYLAGPRHLRCVGRNFAVAGHPVLTALLTRAWFAKRKTTGVSNHQTGE